MRILRNILIVATIIALIVLIVMLMVPKHNYVGIDGYRYHSSPPPCWIEDQLEQIGCSYEEEASPSPSVTSNTGPEGNVPPPPLVDYNLCTYRPCYDGSKVTPGISSWDGSQVGEK